MGRDRLVVSLVQKKCQHFNLLSRERPLLQAVTLIVGLFDAMVGPWERSLWTRRFYNIHILPFAFQSRPALEEPLFCLAIPVLSYC